MKNNRQQLCGHHKHTEFYFEDMWQYKLPVVPFKVNWKDRFRINTSKKTITNRNKQTNKQKPNNNWPKNCHVLLNA